MTSNADRADRRRTAGWTGGWTASRVAAVCGVACAVWCGGSALGQDSRQDPKTQTPPVTPGAPPVDRPRATPVPGQLTGLDDGSQGPFPAPGSVPSRTLTPNRPGATPPAPVPNAMGAQPAVGGVAPMGGAANGGANGGSRPRLRVAAADVELADDEIMLDAFAEGVELRTLVEYLAQELQLNIAGADTLSGSVVLNAPVVVRRDELLRLVDSLLESQGYAIVRDEATGWYKVLKSDSMPINPGGDVPTTRLIATPGIKPSSLSEVIEKQFGQANAAARLSYIDELGVILITDSPRRIEALATLVDTVLDRAAEQSFQRFDVVHISAAVARQRVLELLGQASATPGAAGVNQPVPIQPQGIPGLPAGGGGATANVADRLIADAASNALIFRGFEEEGQRVRQLLAVVDRPSGLMSRRFFAGTSALQIAQLAERRGLGTVETIDTAPPPVNTNQQGQNNQFNPNQNRNQPQPNQQFQPGLQGANQQHSSGGPALVVDAGKGFIIAYGTPSQHEQLEQLIKTFDTEQDLVVIREYPITNRNANDVADVLLGLIGGGTGTDNSNPFLGGANNFQRQFQQQFGQQQGNQNRTGTRTGGTGTTGGTTGTRTTGTGQATGVGRQGTGRGLPGEATGSLGGAQVSIIADQGKNQIIVSAPLKQQEEFSRLIAKLDQRRAQVYLEVQIVSVSAEDTLRVTVENQLINANGTGGAVQSNFGLSSAGGATGATQPFLFPRNVATNLSGLTAAVIKSDQVPIIVNALKRESETRILSAPQLLVDDNESATIVSVDQQPTSQTNLGTGNNNNVVTFQGYEQAGTTVSVTPSISQGGYLRLIYDIELSNFVGAGSNGLPPPRQQRNVSSAVMLPSDSTMVVGGIVVDANSTTKARIPLLGEIPFIGWLFGDTGRTKTSTRLYIFITPRILRDNNFRDLLLLTRGPQADSKIEQDIPELTPAIIQLLEGRSASERAAVLMAEPAVAKKAEPETEAAPELEPAVIPLPEPVAPRPATQPGAKPAAKAEPKPEPKPETKPEPKPTPKPVAPNPGTVHRHDLPQGPSPD